MRDWFLLKVSKNSDATAKVTLMLNKALRVAHMIHLKAKFDIVDRLLTLEIFQMCVCMCFCVFACVCMYVCGCLLVCLCVHICVYVIKGTDDQTLTLAGPA